MTNPHRTATIRFFLAATLCLLATLPAARATEWIIGGDSGTTAFPIGNNLMGTTIQNSDTFTLYSDVTTGGATGANNPLFGSSNGTLVGFTIRSGDGNWYIVSNTKPPAANTHVIQGAGSTLAYYFDKIIFKDNHAASANGSAIMFQPGSTASDVISISGTMIFLNNGGGTPGAGTSMFGGAINTTGGDLLLSGSIVFQGNYGDRSGAINFQNNASSNSVFDGDILFVSNSANTAGAIGSIQYLATSTMTFQGSTRFITNHAGLLTVNNITGGGAIGLASYSSVAAATTLQFTGTTLFDGNTSQTLAGAIYFGGQNLTIGGNTTFINNIAGGKGGAIYQFNGDSASQVEGGVNVTLDSTTGDILFRDNVQNKAADFSQPGERNAITFYSGLYTASGGTTTVTLNTAAGHVIYFYDPIATSETTSLNNPLQTSVNVTITGNGTVLFDRYQSAMASGATTLASGAFLLTNGAIYGSGTAGTGLVMRLQAPAVLAATDGAIMADTITWDPGAQINVSDGGTLRLLTTAFAGAGLQIHGHGAIDTNGLPIAASLVSVGSLVPGTPGASVTNTPQTLTFGASAPLTLEAGGTLAFDMFGGASSDRLAVDTLLFTPGNAYINLFGASGTYAILATNNSTFADGDFLVTVNGLTPSARYAVTSAVTARNGGAGNELTVTYFSKNINTTWTGADPAGLWANTQGANPNWTDNPAAVPELFFMNGDAVTFDDTAASKTVSIDTAGVLITTMTVANTAGNDYAFTGPGGIATTASYAGTDVTPDGKLTKTGDGTLNFDNGTAATGNTFANGIDISGGVIGFTRANQLGDGGNGIHFTDDATLRANANATLANKLTVAAGKTAILDTAFNTLAYTGTLALDATATLAKTGAGTLLLTADNSGNAAKTALNQGTLVLDGAPAKLGGIIAIATDATLAGSGSATGFVTAAPGAIIAPGALSPAAPVTLNINNLTLNSSILRFNLFANGSNDTIHLAGLLTPGTGNTIDLGIFQSGTYNLGNLAGLAGTTVTIGGNAQAASARQKAVVVADSAGDLILQTAADISRILTWTGLNGNTWDPSDENWTDNNATSPVTLFAGGDRVIFDDTATTNRDITLAGSGLYVSDMYVQGDSNYSFAGAGITADPVSIVSGTVLATSSGTGKLYKAGAGTLAFTNAANNFTGGIELSGGAITFTDAAQLGTGANGIDFAGNATLANVSGAGQTLASNIAVATNVTATLDTGANTMTLTGTLAGTGTLVKTGAGQLALAGNSGAPDITLDINEGSLLLNNIDFAGAIGLAANTLLNATGSTAIGTLNTIAGTTLQFSDATLAIGDLQLAASATITGAGSLTGAVTLNGVVAADIAAGNTLTLAAAVNGSGGYLKTGAGALEISGTAALDNTGLTQLDQGALRITGISGTTPGTPVYTGTEITGVIPGYNIASKVTQSLILNGGILTLSGSSSTSPVEATANNWSGLALTQGADAAASAIIGSNEIIYVGAGTFAPALQGGLIVVVNAPGATTVLSNTANSYTGFVRIDSGTLQVTSSAALGAAGSANVKLALNGGAIQFSAPYTTSNRNIEMRADGTVTVDDGVSIQWQQIASPAAYGPTTFTKAGPGTFTLTNALNAANLVVAGGRFIVTSANGVPVNGSVNVHEGAAFELGATGTALSGTLGYIGDHQPLAVLSGGTITTSFMGSGTLDIPRNKYMFTAAKNDIANIVISGSDTTAMIGNVLTPAASFGKDGAITVDQGSIVIGANDATLGNLTLSNGATLACLMPGRLTASSTNTITGEVTPPAYVVDANTFRSARLASLASTGTIASSLWFNTNLALGLADKLIIDAPVSGTFNIGVANYGQVPAQCNAAIELINAPENTAGEAAFIPLAPTIDIDLYSYAVSAVTNEGVTSVLISGTGAMSNSAATINSVAAVLPLGWFTELNSVSQRMGELHFERRNAGAGPGTWIRAYGEQLDFNDKVTGTPFGERHLGTEIGLDYKIGGTPHNIYAGAFFGYGETRRNNVPGNASSESLHGGVYETISTKSGWYLDGVLKVNGFNNRFTSRSPSGATTSAKFHNWAAGASIEAGKYTDVGHGWFFEPQIQGAFNVIKDKTYKTDSGMTVEMRLGTTTRGRVGFRLGRNIETAKWGAFFVYIKAYGGGQWTVNNQLYVTLPEPDADGNPRIARYAPTIKGYYLEGGGGIAWLATKRMQFYADFETTDAEYYIKPWGFNAGIRLAW